MLVLQAKKSTVEQIRAKRRQYCSYKKDQWRSWRECAQAYQQGVEEDMVLGVIKYGEKRAKELEHTKMQAILHNQERVQVQQSYCTTEAHPEKAILLFCFFHWCPVLLIHNCMLIALQLKCNCK